EQGPAVAIGRAARREATRDLVSGRNGSERVAFGGSCAGRAAAGEAGAATLRPWAATVRRAANGSPHSDALTLRKVCRAGSAGRGTPSALSTRAELSLSAPDPRRSLGSALK